MEALIKALAALTTVSSDYEKQLRNVIRKEYYLKNQILIREGQKIEKVYFIEEGFAVNYYFKEGQKFTSRFWQKGDFLFTASDFMNVARSTEYIEMGENSTLYSLDYEDLNEINELFEAAKEVERRLVAMRYEFYEERIRDFQTLKGEERYKKLEAQFPDVIRKSALQNISSYLGITKETLSRYRAKKH
ncbi:hypothetical protein C3K47_11015 [Solitalea longa]|uniref:Cyclic nucleotide-binding domain-containing protein n=1 Tax=Solitalea longa TaxID=2079460 RepID=A0A2S5A112_9SPHI|nr:Crp/Fnr family transcriptional regulator [Solitalea longa]POY36278.1 hypothetical protein C3K47_11015 [Solitalea longa]